MMFWFRTIFVLAIIFVPFTVDAADKKGNKKKDANAKDEKAKTDKVVYGATLIGRLKSISANSDKDFALEISIPQLKINPQAASQANQAQLQRQLLMTRNPYQRLQLIRQYLQQVQQSQRNLFQINYVKQSIDMRGTDDIKIRALRPPIDYDEKGRVKKYTKAELKTMRGTGNLPGYAADMDRLQTNQVVRVYLAKKQVQPKARAAGKKGGNKKRKDKDDDAEDDFRKPKPQVVMIVILVDAPQDKEN